MWSDFYNQFRTSKSRGLSKIRKSANRATLQSRKEQQQCSCVTRSISRTDGWLVGCLFGMVTHVYFAKLLHITESNKLAKRFICAANRTNHANKWTTSASTVVVVVDEEEVESSYVPICNLYSVIWVLDEPLPGPLAEWVVAAVIANAVVRNESLGHDRLIQSPHANPTERERLGNIPDLICNVVCIPF